MSPIVSLGQHPGVGPGGTPRKMFLLNFTKALKKLHLLPIFPLKIQSVVPMICRQKKNIQMKMQLEYNSNSLSV